VEPAIGNVLTRSERPSALTRTVDWNVYSYASGNAIRNIDPRGLTWLWDQSGGAMYHQDDTTGMVQFVASGYAGNGIGMNDPYLDTIPFFGPLSAGDYTIGTFGNQTLSNGKPPLTYAAWLTPDASNPLFGRTGGFLIHGGNMVARNSSTGCIVLPLEIRQLIARSGDKRLTVVPGIFSFVLSLSY